MRINSVFRLIFLVMVVFIVMPTIECSSPYTRIYLDPSDYLFNSGFISTGYKFNITLRVDEIVDLVAWEINMYYNDTIINMTRWFEPTWDSEYVFYEKTTFAAPTQPDHAYNHVSPGNASILVGAILLPLPPNQTSFSGSGKLCILEFIVTAIPSEDETLSCLLIIDNPKTFLLDTDGIIIPDVTKENGYYELHPSTLPDMYTLAITTTSGGTTDPSPGEYSYSAGTQVPVSAIPDINNLFDHWELNGENAGTANPIEVLMNSNHTLHAIFTSLTYNLTLSATAGGTTDPTPGTYTHVNGTVVSITATPDINYKFEYWILDGANAGSDNPIDILMDSNHNLQAVFTEISYQLTIAVTTGGTTDPEPSNYTYVNGTLVPITAIPDSCYEFDHWELDTVDVGYANPYTVTMDDDHALHAVFSQMEYTLTVNIIGSGSVTKNPDQAAYPCGTVVTLTANSDTGWAFSYWSGDLSGSTNPETITMNGDKTVTAHFTQDQYTLTVNIVGSGSVAKDPDQATYSHGTVVELTADPDPCWVFSHWSGDLSGSANSETITMNGDKTVTAHFSQIEYILTITTTSGGTTDPAPDSHQYSCSSNVQVTAIPDLGFSFDYWSLDGEERITNPITIVMDINHTLIPCFVDAIQPEIGDPIQKPSENVIPYQNVTITVNVTDFGTGVYNITLWYSINNGTTWMPLNMTEISTDTYQATIPGYGNCTWVRYRIIAYDNNGNQAIKSDHTYHHILIHMYVTKFNRSITFLVSALIIIIISGVFLLFAKAMHVRTGTN